MDQFSVIKFKVNLQKIEASKSLKLSIYRTDWTAIRRGAARATREIISQSKNTRL